MPTSVAIVSTAGTGSAGFKTAEGLRALLIRLHRAGWGAWRHDPEAAELMEFVAKKFRPLARKYHLDPWEVASAAFDVMLSQAAREAIDPWALVTHAMRITCMSEQRAHGLLCSVQTARSHLKSPLQNVQRFSERRTPLDQHSPLFPLSRMNNAGLDETRASTSAYSAANSALEQTTALLTLTGWPPDVARTGVELVCGELSRVGNRKSAYESLRRDKHALALLDLEHHSWVVLLRTVLGDPRPAYGATKSGRGVLLRLLLGETLESLLSDMHLVESLASSGAKHRKQPTGRAMFDGGAR